MAQTGSKSPSRIGGHTIVDQLIRNMEAGQLEMAYSVLLPCLFSVYLYPDDYERLASVQELIKEDAKRALNARMAELNAARSGKGLLRRGAANTKKQYRIAQQDWWIEFFPDTEGSVPPGDVEIHSELNDAAQPGYRGAKTTLIEREPSVPAATVLRDRRSTRLNSGRVFAEIRYNDDSGPQTFFVTQNEISIGRGGEDLWVDLPLYASDEVSREHARLRRDSSTGGFMLVDNSRNGTWLNGRRITRGVEERLPDRAEIGIAEVVKLSFELRK